MPTLQAYLTDEILRRGAGVFFGVPGDFIIKYFNYLEKRSDVTLVRMNDETHAGSAADAFARIRGFGVVIATYAVGGFKLVNALAQAYVESSPVLIVSGAPARSECQENSSILSYRVHHLVKDVKSQKRVFTEVTGRQEVIDNLHTARSQIEGLLDYIVGERRPGYIEVGRDLLDEKLPRRSIAAHHFIHPPRVSDARALQEAVERSAHILNASQRPILWVGVDVQRLSLQEPVMRLSSQCGIPLVTSLFGKSAIDENFPNHLGIYAGAQTTSTRYADEVVRNYFESADALLVLGVNASDFNFGLGTTQVEEVQTEIIMATKDSVRINTALYPAVLLEDFLEGLLSASLTGHVLPELPAEEAIPPTEPDAAITSDLFFRVLGDHVSGGSVVISDIGDCLFGAGKLRTGYTGFLEPGVYGSMGWSVAASIGAKLADPSLRPLVIVGDGALLMGQESAFAKLVELRLDAVIFVMNNQGYATLQGTSPGSFNRIPNLNFERLTEYAGGGRGFRVTTVGELGSVLQAIRSIKDEPVIVNVVLPPYDKTTTLTRVSQALALGLKKTRK